MISGKAIMLLAELQKIAAIEDEDERRGAALIFESELTAKDQEV